MGMADCQQLWRALSLYLVDTISCCHAVICMSLLSKTLQPMQCEGEAAANLLLDLLLERILELDSPIRFFQRSFSPLHDILSTFSRARAPGNLRCKMIAAT